MPFFKKMQRAISLFCVQFLTVAAFSTYTLQASEGGELQCLGKGFSDGVYQMPLLCPGGYSPGSGKAGGELRGRGLQEPDLVRVEYKAIQNNLPKIKTQNDAPPQARGDGKFADHQFLPVAGAQARYNIGAEDVLRIRIYDSPQVSDDFRVRSDGTISLPVLGAIRVDGMDEGEVEHIIRVTIERMTNRSPSVNVEIRERRPFFVLGEVANPGSYPFIPGMTVKHAIAVAGGIYRLAQPSLAVEASREAGRIQNALGDLKQALVRYARLTAEISGAMEMSVPPRLRDIASEHEVSELMAAEQKVMHARRQIAENLKSSYERQVSFAKKQIAALEQQIGQIAKQLDISAARSGTLEALFSKGLTNEARVMDAKALVARLGAERRAIDSRLAESHANLAAAEREANLIGDRRQAELTADISAARMEISGYERALLESKKIIAQIGGFAAEQGSQGSSLTYLILRRTKAGLERLEVEDVAPMLPGDVVQVMIQEHLPMAIR